ncbi:MAG: GNAT family N-acetyltransferase [Rhizobiaceae bacterium]
MDILVTRRLTLRPPLDVDAEAITAALQNKDVTRMLTNVPNPYGLEDAVRYVKRVEKQKDAVYLSIHRQKLIGMVSIRPTDSGTNDLGYWLERSAWGNGFMSEATRAAVSHAFRKLGLNSITSGAYEDNRASMAVLRKLGFEPDGESLGHNPTRGCKVTCKRMVLTRQRFEQIFGSLETNVAA